MQASIKHSDVHFHGPIHADRDISAIALFNGFLVIGADEAVGDNSSDNYIQLLQREDAYNYRAGSDILLYRGNKQDGKELDIEGIAAADNRLYVLASHSLARKRLSDKNSYRDNRKRLLQVKQEHSRNKLYRLSFDQGNHVSKREQISLSDLLGSDPLLSRFTTIPGKENGIDIEGIAVKHGLIYLGFRGPVLRDGYVPVMRLDFDKPGQSYALDFLNLGGRGIRDLVAVSDGFLVLAGPVGDEAVSFQLLHWNGIDCLPGSGRSRIGRVKLLQETRPPKNAKAEGLALMQEAADSYELIVVFDNARNGTPRYYTIAKRRLESAPKRVAEPENE